MFLITCSLYSQVVIKDTIYPLKILKEKNDSIAVIISDNTNIGFEVSNPLIIKNIQNAIIENKPVGIRYDSLNNRIISESVIQMSDKQLFIEKHEVLKFKKFIFDSSRSLENNEKRSSEAEVVENNLTESIPYDSLIYIFKYFQKLSCDSMKGKCNRKLPCLTFDYKNNGCNARAHWMRKLLAEQFHYDCQKVFLEANTTLLTVINTGNCGNKCIKWGWHVALYVKARIKDGTYVYYVIDPSLFPKPVSLKEWVNIQRQSCCEACPKGDPGEPEIAPSYQFTPNGATDDYYNKTMKLLYNYCRECH